MENKGQSEFFIKETLFCFRRKWEKIFAIPLLGSCHFNILFVSRANVLIPCLLHWRPLYQPVNFKSSDLLHNLSRFFLKRLTDSALLSWWLILKVLIYPASMKIWSFVTVRFTLCRACRMSRKIFFTLERELARRRSSKYRQSVLERCRPSTQTTTTCGSGPSSTFDETICVSITTRHVYFYNFQWWQIRRRWWPQLVFIRTILVPAMVLLSMVRRSVVIHLINASFTRNSSLYAS